MARDPVEWVVLEVTVDETDSQLGALHDALAARIAEAVAARIFGG